MLNVKRSGFPLQVTLSRRCASKNSSIKKSCLNEHFETLPHQRSEGDVEKTLADHPFIMNSSTELLAKEYSNNEP